MPANITFVLATEWNIRRRQQETNVLAVIHPKKIKGARKLLDRPSRVFSFAVL